MHRYPCGHTFHRACAAPWLLAQGAYACPHHECQTGRAFGDLGDLDFVPVDAGVRISDEMATFEAPGDSEDVVKCGRLTTRNWVTRHSSKRMRRRMATSVQRFTSGLLASASASLTHEPLLGFVASVNDARLSVLDASEDADAGARPLVEFSGAALGDGFTYLGLSRDEWASAFRCERDIPVPDAGPFDVRFLVSLGMDFTEFRACRTVSIPDLVSVWGLGVPHLLAWGLRFADLFEDDIGVPVYREILDAFDGRFSALWIPEVAACDFASATVLDADDACILGMVAPQYRILAHRAKDTPTNRIHCAQAWEKFQARVPARGIVFTPQIQNLWPFENCFAPESHARPSSPEKPPAEL